MRGLIPQQKKRKVETEGWHSMKEAKQKKRKLGFHIWKYVGLLGVLAVVGLASIVTRKLQDRVPPVISSDTDVLTISVEDDEAKLLAGMTAVDAVDGDVTDSLLIEQISPLKPDGSRSITYGAFDHSDNVAKYTRAIRYTDYVSPKFSLSGDLIYQTWDMSDALSCIHVQDCLDGDITNKLKLYSFDGGGSSPYHNLNVYVTNSSGETVNQSFMVEQLSVTAAEYAKSPKLSLTEYLIYQKVGDAEPDWKSYLNSLQVIIPDSREWEDVGSFDDVRVTSSVDYTTPGMYEVTYNYTDEAELTGKTRLFVIVEE